MPITALATIKNWFKTRDKPLSSQFWNVFDSFWHKDEEIPISSITNLQSELDTINAALTGVGTATTVTINASGTIILLANFLVDVLLITSVSNQNVNIGWTDNGGELFDVDMTEGQTVLEQILHYSPANKTIYINCTTSVIIKYYRR